MRIEIRGLNKSYGSQPAVRGIGLTVAEGEFVVMLGPSGCGKTTTLRCLAGLEKPDDGEIRIGETVVYGAKGAVFVPPERRNIGMIFQSYALWPHMTVYENVAFPFEARGQRGPEVPARIREVLDMVGLEGVQDRSASLLSGGQMQRVALARALACRPSALLFDEPLSNLDLKLRQHLRQELRELQRRSGSTAVFVTHDQTEAAALADRIVVMNEGRMVQDADPETLFSRPADRFVADFIGLPNLMPFTPGSPLGGNRWRGHVGGLELEGEAPEGRTPTERWFIAFRAEEVALAPGTVTSGIPGRIRDRTFTGSDYLYRIDAGGKDADMTITAKDVRRFDAGERVSLTVSAAARLVPDSVVA